MITFNDIQIKFGNFHAIKNLNLHIKEGEFLPFSVRQGAGKQRFFAVWSDSLSLRAGKLC